MVGLDAGFRAKKVPRRANRRFNNARPYRDLSCVELTFLDLGSGEGAPTHCSSKSHL